MTTVTNNSPAAINTSLFDLEKQLKAEINEIRNIVKSINDEIGDINASETVVSVNGKSGIVKLNANDVGALPEDTKIPNDTAQLGNSAGFITIDDVQGYYVPVSRKVNNKELRDDISLVASDVGALPDDTTHLSGDIAVTEKAEANGVATLDEYGKVPVSQLPSAIMQYKGAWDASTNTPQLQDGMTGAIQGDVYVCNEAGTVNLGHGSIEFVEGDWVMYNGSIWERSANANLVKSVNGKQGVVKLTASDVGALPSTTTGENIKVSSTNTSTVASALNSMVKSVNEQLPDANGNVTITNVKHAATADKATSDANGNNIVNTYATKNDIGNKVNYGFTTMVDLGFTQGSYVSVRDFWTKIYAKYSKGNGVIQFQWANSKSARLGTSTNYVTINGGTLIYTCNSPNNTWSDFSAIYVNGGDNINKVYHIKAYISDNTTAGAERWGIYTLTNTEYINSKLNSLLPWRDNYLTTGYSSSLPYRKIGEGYFNYPTGNWSFYSEIEMLYHRPDILERGTIYIDMRGRGSNVRVTHVRYQYKNGTSTIRLLSNTKVNYKVDTTNKRVYLELLAYCDADYTMILFRNSLTRTDDMLLKENYFWTFAPNATYVQSSDTMQAGVTDGYTEIPMTATGVNITKTVDSNNGDALQIGDGNKVVITNAKHAATADKATSDANGNNIVDTYATKTGLVKSVNEQLPDANGNVTITVDTIKKSDLLDFVYPVGSIYMSVNNVSPQTFLGGTWARIQGRFLLGAGANTANTTNTYGSLAANAINRGVNEQGGEVRHTLTTSEMPRHSHKVSIRKASDEASGYGATISAAFQDRLIVTGSYDFGWDSSTEGNGSAHNNMPPYLVVYMWKRTA